MKEQVHGGDVYRHPDAIDFSSNMNPLGTPQSVVKAGQRAMELIARYPDVQCETLKTALSRAEQVPKEWLICGNGAAEVVFTFVHACMPKKAVMPAPTFAEYGLALDSIGCEIDRVILREEDGFTMPDTAAFTSQITEETDVAFFCNPNNPTGILTKKQQLLEILRHCRKTHTRLFVDECFLDFVEDPERDSLKELLGEYPELILLKAFTKRYAMAGIRLGYGISSDGALLSRMQACVQPWNLSIPAQEAGTAALQETAYVEKGRALIRKERTWLRSQLQEMGLKLYDSTANYIFFQGPKGLTEDCLASGILIRNCSNYEGLTEGYYRVAVKLHEENEKLVEALKQVL
ncbi:MAG: pyridoxal phosphate-dependent class II aminotransferase [Lachnospiraceae bacterium]|nr:pyridoxal phosphate-dependent class II aminotransferase [Lachnospiraceae bacterium]